MPAFDLIAAACQSRSRLASAQSLINLYPERNANGTVTLYGTPGKRLWAAIGGGPIRGAIAANGVAYIVSGSSVYSVTGAGVASSIGAVSSSFGRVSMASNGVDVLLVDGVSGYTITSGVLAEIADADFPDGVRYCDYVDSFYLVGGDGTGKFYKSGSLSGGSWDALDFASAEGDPDELLRPFVSNREILPFGGRTTEFFVDTGAAGFPFERSGNAFLEHGAAAADSIAKLDSSVFWLGRSEQGQGVVWRLNGYSPVRVSTHAEEYAISQWSDISDAYGYAYTQEGHAFYVLSSASGDQTLAYDVASGEWHQRSWRDGSNLRHRDRIYTYIFFNGLHLGGDWENGNVYVIDMDTYTDNGDAIAREIIASHLRSGKRRFYGDVEAMIESGVGLQSGQGSNPVALLSVSDDGGRTFHSERARPFGSVGQYEGRCVWTRNGSAFTRTFRLAVTDPVPVAITGARVEFSE